MRVDRVVEGVYRISLAWSNVYLLVDGEEAALIDTGLQADRAALLAGMAQVGVRKEQVRAVYLTHAHCDHAGNAAHFGAQGAGRAAIHLHAEEARFLSPPRATYAPSGWRALARPATSLLFLAGEWRYPVERCPPDVLLQDGQCLPAPGGGLRVVACPGHTRGHVAYFRERDGLLFSGDALLNVIPVRRVTGLSLAPDVLAADPAQGRQSARRLVGLRPAALLSGHGWPLVDKTAERLESWAQTLK